MGYLHNIFNGKTNNEVLPILIKSHTGQHETKFSVIDQSYEYDHEGNGKAQKVCLAPLLCDRGLPFQDLYIEQCSETCTKSDASH